MARHDPLFVKRCPACGENCIKPIEFYPGVRRESDVLICTCDRCGYTWKARPLYLRRDDDPPPTPEQ